MSEVANAVAPEGAAGVDAGREEAPESYLAMKSSFGSAPAEAAAPEPQDAGAPAEVQPEAAAAGEQPRGPDGKFLPKDAAAEGAAGDVAHPQTDAAAPEGEADAAAEKAPEGLTRVELPEGHPLRARGRTHYEVRFESPEAEAEFRSILAAPVRAQEVDRFRGEAQQHEQRARQLEANLRAANEFNALVFSDPRIISTFAAIKEEHGDGAAAQWLDGLLAQQGQNVQQYVEQAEAEATARAHAESANSFVAERLSERETRYPHWGEKELRDAVAAYGAYLDVQGSSALDAADFYQFADARYIQHPAVQQHVRQWQQEQDAARVKEINEQNAAKERERLNAATALRAENPMGSMPAALNGGRVAPVSTEPASGSYLDHKRALASR
jgi:hypothetical protein